VVIICLAALSCMVCLKVHVLAADTSGSENYMISGDNGDGTVTDGQVLTVDINGMGNATQNFVSAYKNGSIKVYWRVSSSPNGTGTDLVPAYSSSSGTFTLTVRAEDIGKFYTFNVTGDSSLGYNTISSSFKVVTPVINVTIAKNGIATITGSTGSDGSVLTLAQLAELLAQLAGTKVVFELPDALEQSGYSRTTKGILSAKKLTDAGFVFHTHIREGLEKTLEYLKNRGENR